MASAFEPDVRPAPTPPAAPSSTVPSIAWPLVERPPAPRPGRPSGPSAAPPTLGYTATGRLSQSIAPPLAPFRWVAIGVGLVVAYPDLRTSSYRLILGAFVLIAYTAYRTWRPIPYTDDRSTAPPMLFEFALATAVVMLTGAWSSPYTFSLLPAAMLAGFSRGSVFAARLTLVCAVIVSAQHLLVDAVSPSEGVRDCAAWLAVTSVRRRHQRRRPPGVARVGPPAVARPRPPGPPRRGQRAALLAPPRGPDAAGLARPRRRARLHHQPAARPGGVRQRHDPAATRSPTTRGCRCAARATATSRRLDAETLPDAARRRALEARGTVHASRNLAAGGGPGLAPRAAIGPLLLAAVARRARSA